MTPLYRVTQRLASRILGGYGILFLLFLYAPIALIVVFSFNANVVNMMSWSGFTLDWYRSLFGFETQLAASSNYVDTTDQLLAAIKNSVIVALITSLISTVIGTITALALQRHDFRGKRLYQMLIFMPMIMPDIVLGIALLIFFVGAGFQLGLTTIVIGHCVFLSSYVFIIVSARLAGMDQVIEEASADLGADPWVTFRRVTLPLIMPGVLGGALLAFIISLDDLVITYFIAGVESTTLPLFIFGMLRRGIKPQINAIAVMLLLVSFCIAAAGLYLKSRRS
ncbi:MAG: ABC transporter permease [Rhodospirillaceae bacterium]|nr:ABC transporter permease [Rhodospirillaceae bacterium]